MSTYGHHLQTCPTQSWLDPQDNFSNWQRTGYDKGLCSLAKTSSTGPPSSSSHFDYGFHDDTRVRVFTCAPYWSTYTHKSFRRCSSRRSDFSSILIVRHLLIM
eukprot:18751_1